MKFCDFADINPKVKLSKEKKYSFIQMKDISPGHRYVNALKEKVFKDGGSRFEVNDILFARITPCLENGKIAQFKGNSGTIGFGSTEFFVFRAKKGISDNGYLFYLAYSDILRKPAERSMFGASGRQRVALDVVKSIIVPDVSLDNQKKISAVLSAYDDLIENNTYRIQILEEMAQRIYREWFIDFRCPGSKKIQFNDSEIGKIPQGWRVKRIGEILQYHIGGGWGKDISEGKYSVEAYVIRGTDIPDARKSDIKNCPLRYHAQSNFKSREIEDGDVIFEVSGGSKDQPVGRALLINQRMLDSFGQSVICASFCKLMRVNREIISPELFYLKLLSIYDDRSIYKYQVQSTGISNFKFEYFLNNEMIICPVDIVQKEFGNIAESIFNEISLLGQKNMKLQEARDILLPKLISGEIDVLEMDIAIKEHENGA